MLSCDTLIQNARVLDGSGAAPETLDVALRDGRICEIGHGWISVCNEMRFVVRNVRRAVASDRDTISGPLNILRVNDSFIPI